jgi:hypothetical protein
MPANLEVFDLTSTYQLRIDVEKILYLPLSRFDSTGYHIMSHEDWRHPEMYRGTVDPRTFHQGHDLYSWIGAVSHTDGLVFGNSYGAGGRDNVRDIPFQT